MNLARNQRPMIIIFSLNLKILIDDYLLCEQKIILVHNYIKKFMILQVRIKIFVQVFLDLIYNLYYKYDCKINILLTL